MLVKVCGEPPKVVFARVWGQSHHSPSEFARPSCAGRPLFLCVALLGLLMAAPAQGEDCADVPEQPGTRAEPNTCEYDETSGGIRVTLTYANDLAVDYLHSDDPMYPEPADNPDNDPATPNPSMPGGYNPGAYTCLHYYDTGGALLKEISHKENNGVRFSGNRLIFEYEHPEDIGCEEGEMVTVKFEMHNGNPYIEMSGSVVSHIGYERNGPPVERLQATLGTLTCPPHPPTPAWWRRRWRW